MKLRTLQLLLVIDLLGTATFAAQGASVGIAAHLDLLGILVFSFLSSVGGGMLRDVLIGALPPAAIKDWRYPATAIGAGTLMFVVHLLERGSTRFTVNPLLLNVLDSAGHGFYSVSGGLKAVEFGLHPLPAIIMGALTGVGGGVVRDVLLGQVPSVLRTDFNASASMIGAATAIALLRRNVPQRLATAIGVVLCFVVRMLAITYRWHLPHA